MHLQLRSKLVCVLVGDEDRTLWLILSNDAGGEDTGVPVPETPPSLLREGYEVVMISKSIPKGG